MKKGLFCLASILMVVVLSGCTPKTEYINQTIVSTKTITSSHSITKTVTSTETVVLEHTVTCYHAVDEQLDVLTGTTSADSVIAITAKKLLDDYVENEVAAEFKYKDKILRITGEVYSISSLSSGVLIRFMPSSWILSVWSIDCYFDDSFAVQAAQLSKGQKITIQGTCKGGDDFTGVKLRDCVSIAY